jgi:hypothetical protein
MRARGARAPARAIVQLIFPTSITDKKIHQPHHYYSGEFGYSDKYPALVLHYSGGLLLLLLRVRFSALLTGESYYSTS